MTTSGIWRTLSISSAGLLVLAFIAAWALQSSGLLSLTPPPSSAVPAPGPDVELDAALSLYQSAFTAWVALSLLIPTYWAFWFRNSSNRAWTIWLASWAIGAIAYLVHLGVSMFGFFGGDFGWMMTSTRVSAFWPGMIIAVWWPLDVLLALRKGESAGWIRIQRYAIHLIVLILFIGGSAFKGELLVVRVIGVLLILATVIGFLKWAFFKLKQKKAL